MDLVNTPKRFGHHHNAFGFLRLLLASLVIVSHVPEVVDGDARREILTRLSGNLSFGSFAVNGFFIISGFLITGSYLRDRSLMSYLAKRTARIYPAFIVTSALCLVVVAPLAGGNFSELHPRDILAHVFRIVTLQRPMIEGVFPGQHYSSRPVALDGAMWTIQYEFLCYLVVVVLGRASLLRRSAVVGALAALLLLVSAVLPDGKAAWMSHPQFLPGAPAALPGLVGMFLVGAVVYDVQDRIPFNRAGVAIAAIGLAAAVASSTLIAPVYALVVGYLIFAIARLGADSFLSRINDNTDISYGIYLYAWPIEKLLIMHVGQGSLLLLGSLTWLGAAICGYASWILVEKPVLAMVSRRLAGKRR